MDEELTEQEAVEILDNYIWYGKLYPPEIIDEAWGIVRKRYFEFN